MLNYFLKKLISLSMTLLTLYVPKNEYQSALDSLPDIPDRVATIDLQEWTFSEITSTESNITHYYFEYGSRKPSAPILLCLHGFNTDGSVFFNLKSLSDTYRIIAYNFPEKSPFYKGNIRDFSDILDDFCKTALLDTVTILGNSVGGGIALNFAANTKNTVIEKLILSSTTIFGATPENQRQLKGMANKLLAYPDYKLYYLLTKAASTLDFVSNASLSIDVPDNGLVIKHVDWYKEILKAFYWYDGTKDIPSLQCPVTVIHGKNDNFINIKESTTTKALLPHANMHLIEGAAHSLVYSHAAQVDSIIRGEFITRVID